MMNSLKLTNPNVSRSERLISILAGSYLLYDALLKDKKSITEAALSGYLLYRGITGSCAFYNAIGKTKPDNRSRNVNIQLTQEVDKPREEVYNFWRNLENLPLFMQHLENVNALNDTITVWEAKMPVGMGNLRWKSTIVEEKENEILGWKSLPGSEIENAGKVEFEDVGVGTTRLHVVLSYKAPFGIPGEGAARLINPIFEDMLREDVLSFKELIENREALEEGDVEVDKTS